MTIISTVTNVVAIIVIALIVVVPTIWIIMKLKERKQNKNIPEDMDEKIEQNKIDERRAENERKKTYEKAERGRRERLGYPRHLQVGGGEQVDETTSSGDAKSGGDLHPTGKSNRGKDIQVLPSKQLKQHKHNSKLNWPEY